MRITVTGAVPDAMLAKGTLYKAPGTVLVVSFADVKRCKHGNQTGDMTGSLIWTDDDIEEETALLAMYNVVQLVRTWVKENGWSSEERFIRDVEKMGLEVEIASFEPDGSTDG